MALRNILTKEQPTLYKKCRPVTEFNPRLHQLLDDMRETLMDANGVGLAVPGEYGLVKRPMQVKVRAQDRNGNWFEAEGSGLTARCFCHEIDHLDGIVFTSKAERMLTEEELSGGEEE